MRLSLQPDGVIAFTHLHPLEANALLCIPQNADLTDVPEAQQRLYPPPIDESGENAVDPLEIADTAEDWEEYVVPELKELFTGSIEKVQQSLKNLGPASHASDSGEDEIPAEKKRKQKAPPPSFELSIPVEIAEDWYRAMNQARLVMSQKSLWIDQGGQLHGPLMSQIHYEIYAHIQGWLVDNVLAEP